MLLYGKTVWEEDISGHVEGRTSIRLFPVASQWP